MILGINCFLSHSPVELEGKRWGLLSNQASVNMEGNYSKDLLWGKFKNNLKSLLSPQHGFWGTEQDNMIETGHGTHPRLGLPVFSLYSETREPTEEMLAAVDTVLVDIQDVGTRVYTFATTVLYLMQACARSGRKVIVLDRPNPINGKDVEGNLLQPECASFVGPYPLPMRHGLTLGELMTLYNGVYQLRCSLEVVAMTGWKRNLYFEDTGLPWVLPSPNMPLVETAVVYPGQVALEGTTLSEGRGTTRPFEIFGAPYFDPDHLKEAIEPQALDGAVLREISFKPTFNKYAGQACRGFQIHVVNRDVFSPYRASLGILSAILKLYSGEFRWTDPPYEYVTDKLPIDVILGDRRIREDLEQGRSVSDMEQEWQAELDNFARLRSRFLLYP